MTDLYIATPTQADYDALMLLAEAKGYEWYSKHKPTDINCFAKEDETVIRLNSDNRKISLCQQCELKDKTIEMIPDLSSTIAVYEISRDSWDAFSDEYGSYKWRSKQRVSDRMPHSDQYVVLHEQNKIYSAYQPKYSALAVEYKPKESEEVMPEKILVPKFIYDLLEGRKVRYPATALTITDQIADQSSEARRWLADIENQWKLIDALRYGYEAEPEQLYYVIMPIDRTHCFLNQNEDDGEVFFDEKDAVMRIKVKFTMPEILAIDPRYKAFAERVEEVDGYEAKNCD